MNMDNYFLEKVYTAKNENFLEQIKDYFNNKPINNYEIKPIQFTMEVTNMCTCNCYDCGMNANRVPKRKLSNNEYKFIFDELSKFGIPSVAITGGEPFMEFDTFCEIFNKYNLDLIKIVSNGYWGKDASIILPKLENFAKKNQFFNLVLLISLGEQTIPVEIIENIFSFAENNINILNLGISNTRFLDQDYSNLEKFIDFYIDKNGHFPNEKFCLTDSYYILKEGKNLELYPDNLPICNKNFDINLGESVSPKIFMKVNGDCYPCEVFQINDCFYLGNIFEIGIENIVKNYNNNKYINFVKKYGTNNFKNILTKDMINKKFPSTCDYCKYVINKIKENNLL